MRLVDALCRYVETASAQKDEIAGSPHHPLLELAAT